jgi:hypothetical protein
MSSTAEGQKAKGRYAVERALAPHVEEKWAEDFVVELLLLHIEGARIGAALSEVESHCSDSGQGAQQAFGDPIEYARSLQLPVEGDHSGRALLRSLAPIGVQIVGASMLNPSFGVWLRGQQLEITTGHFVNQLILLLGLAAICRFADALYRMLIHHPVLGGILVFSACMATTASCVVSLILLDDVIWRVPAGWGVAAGAATLAGGVVWAVARLRAHGSDEVRITSPFETADTASSKKSTGPLGRLSGSSLLATFPYVALIPLATLFFLATDLLLNQMKPG